MKKIAFSLIALAALSTASFAAENRNWDLQDRAYFTTQGIATGAGSAAIAAESPLALDGGASSNFERLQQNMMKNESSSH